MSREANLERLLHAFPNATLIYSNDPRERFAAVSTSRPYGTAGSEHYVSTHATFEEACAHVADAVLDGDAMEAIFDLDTAERIDLHVTTPVVTRAEDQGVVINPLRPDSVKRIKVTLRDRDGNHVETRMFTEDERDECVTFVGEFVFLTGIDPDPDDGADGENGSVEFEVLDPDEGLTNDRQEPCPHCGSRVGFDETGDCVTCGKDPSRAGDNDRQEDRHDLP